MLRPKPQLRQLHSILPRKVRATISDSPPALQPSAATLPPSPQPVVQPPLSVAELHLIFSRRMKYLNLPDNPHLLLSESLSTNLTSLFALLFKLHVLQTSPVTALRTSHGPIFHALRVLSLSQLPPIRLLLHPVFRLLPPLHWLTIPFQLFASPFLLDTIYQFIKSRIRERATPPPVHDLHHLRNHITETLATTKDNLSTFISKKTAELRREVDIKIPPSLHLPGPPPLPPRSTSTNNTATTDSSTDAFKTPTTGRSEALRLRTPVKPKPRRLSKGLGSLADGESPNLSLLPSSIARPVETPPLPAYVVSAPAALQEKVEKVEI